jgi:hypothetical protein
MLTGLLLAFGILARNPQRLWDHHVSVLFIIVPEQFKMYPIALETHCLKHPGLQLLCGQNIVHTSSYIDRHIILVKLDKSGHGPHGVPQVIHRSHTRRCYSASP